MKSKVKVFPHNDLFNLAHYHREQMNKKLESGGRDGISLDCMSCLIALAFTVEALVNLVGHKRIDKWKERDGYLKKMNRICSKAGVNFRKCVEPYKTLWELKEMRDSMAHGKPVEITTEIKSREELKDAMECPWDKKLTPEYVNHAYECVKKFERTMFENCNISVIDAVTSSVPLPRKI